MEKELTKEELGVRLFYRRIAIIVNKFKLLISELNNPKKFCEIYDESVIHVYIKDFHYKDIYFHEIAFSTKCGNWAVFSPSESLQIELNPRRHAIDIETGGTLKKEMLRPMLNMVEDKICRAIKELEAEVNNHSDESVKTRACALLNSL